MMRVKQPWGRVLVCFNWLSFPSRTEVGRAMARASARVLVCLIGFHFLILSLHLPSTAKRPCPTPDGLPYARSLLAVLLLLVSNFAKLVKLL